MKRNFLITLALITLSLILNTAPTGSATAATGDQVIGGLANTGKAAGMAVGDSGAPKTEFAAAFGAYATGFAAIMSAFFVILTIYGGWLWMTAQGNEEKVTMGKMRLISGAIGLGIVIGGRLIAELVIYYLGQSTLNAPATPTN